VVDDPIFTENLKWDDMSLRISRIADVVENAVEEEKNKLMSEEIVEKTLLDNLKDNEEIKQIEAEESIFKADQVKNQGQDQKISAPSIIKDSSDVFDPRDVEISLLKARLEETEKAMERIVAQMGVVTSRLAPNIIAQAFEGVNFDKDPSNDKVGKTFLHQNCIKENKSEE